MLVVKLTTGIGPDDIGSEKYIQLPFNIAVISLFNFC